MNFFKSYFEILFIVIGLVAALTDFCWDSSIRNANLFPEINMYICDYNSDKVLLII